MSVKVLRRRLETSVGKATGYHRNYRRASGAFGPPPKEDAFELHLAEVNEDAKAAERASKRTAHRRLIIAVAVLGIALVSARGVADDPEAIGQIIRGSLLYVALLGALGATLYVVFLVADQIYDARHLDRMRWVDDHEGRLDIIVALRRIPDEKEDRARNLLLAARQGRDGAARLHAGRILRAWALVAFPLAAIPIALMLALQLLLPAGLGVVDSTVSEVTGEIDGAVRAARVGEAGLLTGTITIPAYVPATTGIVSPFVGAVLSELREFLDSLLAPALRGAYVTVVAATFGGLWALTLTASTAALAAGGKRRGDWEREFRAAWKDVLPRN